jgi:uncharacterized protein (DUF427 family)
MSEQRGRVHTEPSHKRVRAVLGGELIVDTTDALYVWEGPHYPQYYLPLSDVTDGVLHSSPTTAHSPSRGNATYYTVRGGKVERVDAAYSYDDSPMEELRGRVRFDWKAMDAWFEEDEEVFVHARSPYTRIDILPTSRPVRVELNGVVLAASPRALVLHETGLQPRWYLPKVDVRMDLLEPTDQSSRCPYKGQAEYWSAHVGDEVVENIAWSYRTPLPESERIAGHIAFYDERVELFVDGERRERPAPRSA